MSTHDGATFEYTRPFQSARPRKNRKNKKTGSGAQIAPAVALDRTRQELITDVWIQECKHLIRESLHLLSVTSPEVLCLGLGSPAAYRDPRAQLVFLLEVSDDLSLDRSNISVYDPVFTEEDERLLDDIRNAAYALPNPSIAYMPHCDLQLYENILRENWTSNRLPKLLLIANRFSEYVDNVPSQKLSAAFPCVSRIAPHLTSQPLPPCPSHPTAFNNIAIQYIRLSDLPPSEDIFWELPPVPPKSGSEESTNNAER
ncbi:unnamed protein product [Somion occarium]|uniref:SRR1-like domain-containing protein n=1 Tax=Somion occarium TaxID=3059160 RepID=A0ABP1DAP2_9APHY